jgi:hypothetical protein
MSYFRELPNLEYQSFLSSRKGSDDYLLVKNVFRRVKLRDDLQNVFTIFNKYQIQEGARPDTVAEELYGSSQYDWVVLIGANIINVRNEWPLSDRDIYRYSEELYGNDLNAVHHYETTEVKDSNGRLILPAGKIVDSTFTIPNPDISLRYPYPVTSGNIGINTTFITGITTTGIVVKKTIYEPPDVIAPNTIVTSIGIGTVFINQPTLNITSTTKTFSFQNPLENINPVVGISNYEYEVRKNDKKKDIYVLKPSYLQQVVNDTRKAMTYDKSSQYVNDKLIRTENTRVTMP